MGRHFARISAVLAGFSLLIASAPAAEPQSSLSNGWRLLRTANPRGGPDAVSISHTADVTRSDLDLAGAMLRCSPTRIEFLIVTVTLFSPKVAPEVTISAGGREWRFAGHVVPPGAELLLPSEATSLASGAWQSAGEINVKVTSNEQSFAGVIPLVGLSEALPTLAANCPAG